MSRIRSVKPEFWTDPAVTSCSPLARLLFVGSWNHADDYPERLRLQVLPADPHVDAHELIEELVQAKLLVRMTAPDSTPVLVVAQPFWNWCRTRTRGYRPAIPGWMRAAVLRRDGRVCRWCGSTYRPEVDHRVPWSKGGEHTLDNLQVLCRPCNIRKGARI